MDYAALAAQFGGTAVPQSSPVDNSGYGNIMNGLSPKDQADMKKKIYDESVKRLDALREVTAKGSSVLNDLNQFGELNRKTSTGSMWDSMTSNVPSIHSDDFNTMNAIQSRLGPAQRIQGSGSSSDRDVKLFMAGLPSTNNRGNTNRDIREQYQKDYNYALEKQTFLENYLNQHGHLNGADQQWQASRQVKPMAQEASQPKTAISAPKEAINMLKMNPKLAADFDAKYGAGASKTVLGN